MTDRFNDVRLEVPRPLSDTPLPSRCPALRPAGPRAATCSLTTTADAVLADIAREGQRAIWELGQVQVFDGGADGDGDTAGDNTLFAVQGAFTP